MNSARSSSPPSRPRKGDALCHASCRGREKRIIESRHLALRLLRRRDFFQFVLSVRPLAVEARTDRARVIPFVFRASGRIISAADEPSFSSSCRNKHRHHSIYSAECIIINEEINRVEPNKNGCHGRPRGLRRICSSRRWKQERCGFKRGLPGRADGADLRRSQPGVSPGHLRQVRKRVRLCRPPAPTD